MAIEAEGEAAGQNSVLGEVGGGGCAVCATGEASTGGEGGGELDWALWRYHMMATIEGIGAGEPLILRQHDISEHIDRFPYPDKIAPSVAEADGLQELGATAVHGQGGSWAASWPV